MDAGVMVVLATLGVVIVVVVVAMVVDLVREARARAQVRSAQEGLAARPHARHAVANAAATAKLAGPTGGRVGQPRDAVTAGDPPENPAVTAIHARQAS